MLFIFNDIKDSCHCIPLLHLLAFLLHALSIFKPDRGAKRPRGEEKGGSGGDEESRGVKHQKGHNARYREASMGVEVRGETRENEEMNGEKKMILEKLLDQDEEEPEVGGKKSPPRASC